MTARLHGLIAEFESVDALIAATRAAKAEGYRRIDTYTPFPVQELTETLGYRTIAIPIIAVGTGIVGALIQYGAQYWMNVVDYPLNVGGRPLHSWPAFIPATLIVAVLWTAASTLIGMLVLCRLPRLHHPVFAVPGFERASEDRFFLCIRAVDPLFKDNATREFLARQGPAFLRDVPE